MQFPGKHEPLVDAEIWESAQVVAQDKVLVQRGRVHAHYLKSTLWCGMCRSRMIIQRVRGRNGSWYQYFSCVGRHNQTSPDCNQRYIATEHAEDLVEQPHAKHSLTLDYRQSLEKRLMAGLKELQKETLTEREQLQKRLEVVERKQRKLLEAHYNDAIPVELLREEQEKLQSEHAQISRKLRAAESDMSDTEEILTLALDLAEDIGRTNRTAPDSMKRQLNLVFTPGVLRPSLAPHRRPRPASHQRGPQRTIRRDPRPCHPPDDY